MRTERPTSSTSKWFCKIVQYLPTPQLCSVIPHSISLAGAATCPAMRTGSVAILPCLTGAVISLLVPRPLSRPL